MARKELRPEDITAIVDPREQRPWALTPLKTEVATLYTGDYSVKGLENVIAIERKSLEDIIGCVGQNRERFEHCIKRMLAYPVRAVIVEATWADLEGGAWRSKISPASAVGSVLGWVARGIPFQFAGDASKASTMAARLMFIAARRRWEELGAFYDSLKVSE